MKIEDKIKEVSDYFKEKLLEGDYKFIKCNEHKATVQIDNKYMVDLWTANDIKRYLDVYEPGSILSNEISFNSEKERIKVWGHLEPYVLDNLKKERIKDLKLLKAEIERLEK
jgi:hypothetical protein